MIRHYTGKILAWRERRRTIAALSALDAHLLADIGHEEMIRRPTLRAPGVYGLLTGGL